MGLEPLGHLGEFLGAIRGIIPISGLSGHRNDCQAFWCRQDADLPHKVAPLMVMGPSRL